MDCSIPAPLRTNEGRFASDLPHEEDRDKGRGFKFPGRLSDTCREGGDVSGRHSGSLALALEYLIFLEYHAGRCFFRLFCCFDICCWGVRPRFGG